MTLIDTLSSAVGSTVRWLNYGAPLLDLGVRLYLANVF